MIMVFSSWKKKLEKLFAKDAPPVFSVEDIRKILYEGDVPQLIISEVLRDVSQKNALKSGVEILDRLKQSLSTLMQEVGNKKMEIVPPQCIVLVGINGVGKTTTAARLAYMLSKKYPVVLGAADTFRAGASEQLKEWGVSLNLEVVTGEYSSDPAAVAFQTWQTAKAKQAVAIIDTAGRMHTKSPLMDQLKKIERVLTKEPGVRTPVKLLVLDGNLGQNSILQAKEFSSSLALDGIILTKMDGTSKAGFILQIVKELSLPVFYIGVGEKSQDLIEFDTEAFVSQLL